MNKLYVRYVNDLVSIGQSAIRTKLLSLPRIDTLVLLVTSKSIHTLLVSIVFEYT